MNDSPAGPRKRSLALALAVVVPSLAVGLPAAAWEPDPAAPAAALEAFHRHFSAAAYPYPRHSAKPLGVIGFDIWADAAVAPDFEDEVRPALTDGVPGGLLTIYRVGGRKGLPWGIDLGASYGRVLDSDLELLNAEVSWAILEGGAVTPALGLRFTGGRGSGDAYELEQYGAEVLLSKGFAVLTPYAGAGWSFSESTFERPGGDLTFDSSRGFLYGGVILNLLIPKITVEVEQGETLQGAVRVAFGL
ncbi:MAG TPA: hypothetical protein VM599_02850 [Thermoanaerobaculia bacterium]|nr:hypothetical protein [Thermoanaerobaculia bacterium]